MRFFDEISKIAKGAGKAEALGKSGYVLKKVEAGRDPHYFSYNIEKDGKRVGEISGFVEGEVADIQWIGSRERLSKEVQMDLREQFRKDFPKVSTFTGHRISGAHSRRAKELRAQYNAGEIDEHELLAGLHKAFEQSIQTVKIPAIAAAIGMPLAADSDEAEAGVLSKLFKSGKDVPRKGWALTQNQSKQPERSFRYDIYKDGEKVGHTSGSIDGHIAHISWFGDITGAGIPKLSPQAIRTLREAFRKDFPDVNTFQGLRVSGARHYSAMELRTRASLEKDREKVAELVDKARNIRNQKIILPGLAGALTAAGAAIDSDDADAANAKHFLGKWGLTDNVHPYGNKDISQTLPKHLQKTGIRNYFKYEIKNEGKDVGVIQGFVRVDPKNPEAGPTATIMWVGDAKTPRTAGGRGGEGRPALMEGSGAIHPKVMKEALRKILDDFPDLQTIEGHRLSGSMGGETVTFKVPDLFKKGGAAGAAGIGALGLADEDAEAGVLTEKAFRGGQFRKEGRKTNEFWATSSPEVAEEYANEYAKVFGEGPTIIPATMNFKKPLVIDTKGSYYSKIPTNDIPELEKWIQENPKKAGIWSANHYRYTTTDVIKEYAKKTGHDGVIFRNVLDPAVQGGETKLADSYVALKKGTVKSSLTGENIFTVPAGTAVGTGAAGIVSGSDEAEASKKMPTLNDLPMPEGDTAPPQEGEDSSWRDIAMLPLDLLSFNATGMRASEAVDTVKEVATTGAEMADNLLNRGNRQHQVAEALTPDAPLPEDAAPIQPLPEGSELVSTNPNPPQKFWSKISGRYTGSDIGRDDPQYYERMSSMIGGAFAGGMIGAKAPGPPQVKAAATLLGSSTGLVSGALFPEATMEFLEATGYLPKGYRDKHGLTDAELRTLAEGELLIDMATGMGLTIAQTASRAFSQALTGMTRGDKKLAEDALDWGISMMPVQVGERQAGRSFVNVFGRFPFLGTNIKKTGKESAIRLQEAYRTLPERIAPAASSSDIHLKVFQEVGDTAQRINDQFVPQFDAVMSRPDVSVRLSNTSNAVLDMVDDVGAMIPTKSPQAGKRTKVEMPGRVKELQNLLNRTLRPIVGEGETAEQTLKQVDNLLGVVDGKIADFAKKGDIEAVNILSKVRTSLQRDMVENLGGPGAQQARSDLMRLSEEWTHATEELFTNAVARRMGITPAQGFRAMQFTGNQQKIGQTINMVLKSEDPGMVKDLSRILKPETFREMTAAVLKDRIDDAFVRRGDGTVQLSPGKFADAMGLNVPGSELFKQTEELLKGAGNKFTMQDLQRLDEIAKRIESVDLPDVSTFVARRASLAGLRGVLGSIPTALLSGAAGGAATNASGFPVLGLFAGAMSLRLMGNSLANPANARVWHKVMDETASQAVRWAAYNRAGRMAISALQDSGEISETTAALYQGAWDMIGEVFKEKQKELENGD